MRARPRVPFRRRLAPAAQRERRVAAEAVPGQDHARGVEVAAEGVALGEARQGVEGRGEIPGSQHIVGGGVAGGSRRPPGCVNHVYGWRPSPGAGGSGVGVGCLRARKIPRT